MATEKPYNLKPDTSRGTEAYRGPVITPAPVVPLFLNRPSTHARRKPRVRFDGRRIHFMGAGGIGVSALMELCAARGAEVSGCDCSANAQVQKLRAQKIPVESTHSPEHVCGCDELVHTAAVGRGHPEIT